MKIVMPVLAALGAAGAALAGAAAAHAEPSSRYCEAGYAHGDVDESAQVTVGLLGALLVSADGGGGLRAGCVVPVHGGLYVHGDVRQYELDGLIADGFPGPILGDDSQRDATAREWRAGVGYAVDVSSTMAAYGQAAFMRSDYYDDFEATGLTLFEIDNPGARDGVSLEAGLRWLATPRLELAGYGRWDSEGAFGFDSRPPETCCDLPGTLVYEDGSDLRGGASAAFRVAGPLWMVGGYEVGDIDSGFLGARVAF